MRTIRLGNVLLPVLGTVGDGGTIDLEAWARIGRKPRRSETSKRLARAYQHGRKRGRPNYAKWIASYRASYLKHKAQGRDQ